MSLLDRAIGYVAPQAALRRAKAQYQLNIIKRSYDGAALSRHTEGWITGATSADTELYGARTRLRDRSRDLVRNNPHAAKAVTVWANNIVGDGIMPRPKTGDPSKDKKVKELFTRWVEECDADGQLDFYGLQTLACREVIESGEVLARRRRRLPKDGLSVPVQIQILEPDYLDDTKNGLIAPNGNTVIQGIEFDQIGSRAAYWLWRQHPGSFVVNPRQSIQSNPVPAGDVVHCYEKQRTQIRGAPWFTPVIRKMRDLDDYEHAELIRKKMEAAVVGIVLCDDEMEMGVNPVPGNDPTATPFGVQDINGNQIERFEPGMFAYARGGKDIRFNTPGVLSGHVESKSSTLMDIAAGLRMPHELLTGDLSNVNYSSMRASLTEFRRVVRAMQWHVFIPMCLQPQWNWFCEAAFLAGHIDNPIVPVEWAPPKFDWVDPTADSDAEKFSMRAGNRTFQEICTQRGRDPIDVLDEIEWFQKELKKREITLDSDPSQVSNRGVVQSADPLAIGDTPPVSKVVKNGANRSSRAAGK